MDNLVSSATFVVATALLIAILGFALTQTKGTLRASVRLAGSN